MAENLNPTIEEQLASLASALKEQQAIAAAQATIIAELKGAQVKENAPEKPKLVIPKDNVKVGGKEYKFRLPHFIFNNEKVLAEDAALDAALLKKIVAVPGQNVLIEQA